MLPNFLIIGPPKTGSTSLWHYVRQHPDIYMSDFKEPSYFWTDAPAWKTNRVDTVAGYAGLFRDARGHTAVGEASPTYFADPGAPYAIEEALTDVKLISILRDPRTRVFSEYVFQLMRGFEPEASLLGAIKVDASRPRNERVGYVDQSLYHKHLTRYLAVFPEERVLTVFSDDLKREPERVVTSIFSFLGVDPEVRVDTSAELTVSGKPRVKAFHRLLSDRNPLKRAVTPLLPAWAKNAGRRIRNANLQRQAMTPEERKALRPYFDDDIRQLESVLGRDLSAWLAD